MNHFASTLNTLNTDQEETNEITYMLLSVIESLLITFDKQDDEHVKIKRRIIEEIESSNGFEGMKHLTFRSNMDVAGTISKRIFENHLNEIDEEFEEEDF